MHVVSGRLEHQQHDEGNKPQSGPCSDEGDIVGLQGRWIGSLSKRHPATVRLYKAGCALSLVVSIGNDLC